MDYWGTRFNEPTSILIPSHTTTTAAATATATTTTTTITTTTLPTNN
jgi:hypothetical protein